jgi:nucleoid DNA-binding protein
MRLKELSEAIASACNVRPNIVSSVQTETFRQLRAAIEKGEKVAIPDFGIFLMKDVEGENGAPAKKVIRFRAKSGENAEKAGKKGKGKKAAEKAESAETGDEE